MERRKYNSRYDDLLPEFFPIKLIGAFISLDFIVGCPFDCSFCISRRHPARAELFREGVIIDNRVSPQKMYQWLKSMPSFEFGVQIRIGHDTDAGLQFEKSTDLIDILPPDKSVVYLSRKPLVSREVRFFQKYRPNLLLKLTATPRSESLGVRRNPINLIRSVKDIDPGMLYWVVGPLVADNLGEAHTILEALPAGSRLFLKKLNYAGLPGLDGVRPLDDRALAALEKFALDRGHVVTEWFCDSLARIGRVFFDVDKIRTQPASAKKERELGYCLACPSRVICFAEISIDSFRDRLAEGLEQLGLKLQGEPRQTAPHSFRLEVGRPASRGDETFLNHFVHPPLSFRIETREKGISQGGSFCNVEPDALRRWYEHGFFPVGEMNTKSKYVIEDVRRIFENFGNGGGD